MDEYEYPKLSRSEIIKGLADAQVANVTDADLRKPSPDFISELYTRILIYLDILREEDQEQVEFEALEQLENPENHVTSAQAMNRYKKVKYMLEMVACPLKFNFKDMLRPEASRTQYFISALLNYGLHRDSKMVLISETVDELALVDEQRKQCEATISQLNAEIAKFDEISERELPFVQELETNIEELNQKILGLNNEQLSLRAAFQKMREKTTQMDNEISKAEFDLVQTVQENASLRSQIVQSPDKLQAALEEKKLVLGETKKAEQSVIETFQEKAAILEVYEMALKKMSKSSSQLQLINEQVTNAKSNEKDVKALKAKLSEDEVSHKSLEAKVVEGERRAEQLHESLMRLEKEKAVVFEEWTKQLNETKLKVESTRRDLETRQKDVESVVAMVDFNTAKTNEAKQSGEAKVKRIAAKFEEIVKEFHEPTKLLRAILPSSERRRKVRVS